MLVGQSEALRAELAKVRNEMVGVLVPLIDDQLFYAMTGYRNLGEAAAPRSQHFSEKEFERYRHLSALQADVTIAIQLLSSAFNLSDAPLIEPLRSALRPLKAGLSGAYRHSERPMHAVSRSDMRASVPVGFGRARRLRPAYARTRTRRATAGSARTQSVSRPQSGRRGRRAVSTARMSAQEATRASTQAISTGRNLLLVLNVISIIGALLIAYLFVGRVLLRRLEKLSGSHARHWRCDLEGKVEIDGRDEVADMAAALEVFRRHALEVQRLNLVEKLAEELQDKNAELEKVLEDLRVAQDQIVMPREIGRARRTHCRCGA